MKSLLFGILLFVLAYILISLSGESFDFSVFTNNQKQYVLVAFILIFSIFISKYIFSGSEEESC